MKCQWSFERPAAQWPPVRAVVALLLGTLLGLPAAGQAAAAEARVAKAVLSQSGDRQALALTVYNDNLALVRDQRQVLLGDGLTRLSIRDVASKMQAETAMLRALQGSALALVEQNFDFDLLTPQKMLDKYVGRDVTVIRTNPATGAETREKATVLATNGGTVLRFADRIETGIPGRLAFDSVPDNLRDRPTLSVVFDAQGGSRRLELSYLTGGLTWKADYVANLSPDGTQLDLGGWVTLTNDSGASYEGATLQLVAGALNRVRPPENFSRLQRAAPAAAIRDAAPVQENLFEYHLYSFENPTTIAQNQTKQLALLSATGVPVQRQYLLEGADYYYRDRAGQIGQRIKPAVFLSFTNGGDSLGKPLPAGTLRVYAKDSKGRAQFVGEDRIAHTARNEKINLRLGEAFDITADRTQTQFRKIADNIYETSYRIEVRNAKDEAVTVTVREPIPGDWEVVAESARHQKDSSRRASWSVVVPASGKTVLDYTVRVRY